MARVCRGEGETDWVKVYTVNVGEDSSRQQAKDLAHLWVYRFNPDGMIWAMSGGRKLLAERQTQQMDTVFKR